MRCTSIGGVIQDNTERDCLTENSAELCARNGISPETTVVFYGDKSNWWSAYALWAFRLLTGIGR